MSDDQLIPIREISRLTGVNSVTLRAWERRYGLIKPSRTHKGHRLYDRNDVALIQQIQSWLARGLAIGKVSELLVSSSTSAPTDLEASRDDFWNATRAQLIEAVNQFHLSKIDQLLQSLLSVYPTELVVDNLMIPVLDSLSTPLFGNALKKTLFVSRTVDYLSMLIHRQRQGLSGNCVGILQLPGETHRLTASFLHYGLTMTQINGEVIGAVPADEFVLAKNQLSLRSLVVFFEEAENLSDAKKYLQQLIQKIDLPVLIGGKLSQYLLEAKVDLPRNVQIIPAQTMSALLKSIGETAQHSLS